jgi:hypothetical protein
MFRFSLPVVSALYNPVEEFICGLCFLFPGTQSFYLEAQLT